MTTPTLAAVVCAYTEERWQDIVDAVTSLRQQSPKPDQIILVIDNNKPLFEKANQELKSPDIAIIENSQTRGLSGARNSGVAVAKTEIIAFLDDDAEASEGWCRALLDCFSDPDVVGVGGLVQPRWRAPRPTWWPSEFDWVVGCSYTGLPLQRGPIRNPIGANMAVRKSALDEAGPFSHAIGRVGKHPVGCEETELFIRINQTLQANRSTTVLYEPQAKVSHNIPASRANLSYFLRRCFAEGLSKAVVSKLVGSQDALSSERTYSTVTLPKGVARGIRDGIKGDRPGFARAGAIVAGLVATTIGYARGRMDSGKQLRLPKQLGGGQ